MRAKVRPEMDVAAASRLAGILFGLSLLVYAVTRLWAIEDFPVYFFTDEAAQTIFARHLAEHGFRDSAGRLLPLYFEVASDRMAPLLSVYLNYVTMSVFGQSVLVTRATTAIFTILGAVALALVLRRPLAVRHWWLGPAILAAVPAWFIHSRTGFETVMMAAAYAVALLFYLVYRTASPRWLYAAVVMAAAAFYLYSNGQAVVVATAALLAASDYRYHRRHARTVLAALALGIVLALPFARFATEAPEAMSHHLRAIGSYLYSDELTPVDKARAYVSRYALGLSPLYWFTPDQARDLVRHRIPSHGHLNWWLLPFFVAGVAICLSRWRSPPHRAIVLAALATPIGAAMADIYILRVLAFVVPATVLAALGMDALLRRLGRLVPERAVALGVFALVSASTLGMTRDAVANGARWTDDYGLYGLQWGARQLFEETIPAILDREPDTTIYMSSDWANGANSFPQFFLTPAQSARVYFRSVDELMVRYTPLTSDMLFVMTEHDRNRADASGKFEPIQPEHLIRYPNGEAGFFFTRLAYKPGVAADFARQKAERRAIVSGTAVIDGRPVAVRHSRSDMGELQNAFDGDAFTLLRGMEANPFVLEIEFPEPRAIGGIEALFGHMPFTWTAELTAPGAARPVIYKQAKPASGLGDVSGEIEFDRGPHTIERLRLVIHHDGEDDTANVHLRELVLRD
jgi:hypothetical protein